MTVLVCAGCHRPPAAIDGYRAMLVDDYGERLYATADDYVWDQEGTLNRRTGQFLCDGCYIKAGMPTGPGGWTVPDSWSDPSTQQAADHESQHGDEDHHD